VHYDATVLAYHGCDAEVAERLARRGAVQGERERLRLAWKGIYFWEYGADRAYRFRPGAGRAWPSAEGGDHRRAHPARALLHLIGHALQGDLAAGFSLWERSMGEAGVPLPKKRV